MRGQAQPNTMVSKGRPRTIKESDVRKLVELFKEGHTVSTACRISGVPRSTYYDEINRNEEFSDRIHAAQEIMTWRATQIVVHSLASHNLQTAKWWLDREARREYNAQRAAEVRLIKKLTLTETYQKTRSVSMEMDQ